MIRSFKHKGLKRFYTSGDARKILSGSENRIENILSVLDMAKNLEQLKLPTFELHPLKGNLQGFMAIKVTRNWRIIFRILNGDVFEVDLVDYH